MNLLLWKPMLLDTDSLAPGVRGDGVRWLRDSLRQILHTPIPTVDPLYFDDELAARVREFQRRHRLTVDAVVGAQTQIVIQTELGLPGIPLLTDVAH
jgi:peptidoglycan hydrolase-like protein with peptidoglycan-binding domain